MAKKLIKVKKVKKKRKKSFKLPRRLLFVPSSDKNFTESWKVNRRTGLTNRDPLDFPASWRMILCGKPGCGKTSMIKNVIMRVQSSKKPFERIFVLHQDPRATEYKDIDAEIITELPENDFWMGYDPPSETDDSETVTDPDGSSQDLEEEQEADAHEYASQPIRPKTLVIIDDICFKDMHKRQTVLLDRLCGFISTHCNVSLAVLNQDVFAIDPIIRKCCNIWCIWKPSDSDQCMTISRRAGLKSKELEGLFDTIAPGELDSIMIDKTSHTPYPLRKNAYEIIERKKR